MFLSDQDLIAKSCSGDLDAFEALVKKYQQKVYTIAYRLLGNHADANDIAQEAFIKIYRSLPKFRGDSSFQTWLYHIVTNTCRDQLRKKRLKLLDLHDNFDEVESKSLDTTGTGENDPETALIQKENQSDIQQCLNALSLEHRMVLILREIQGFSYEEIAKHLDCNLGTVKSKLSRARSAFKDLFLTRQNQTPKEIRKKGKEGEIWIVKK